MALAYRISCPQFPLTGTVSLESSKSISNRVLIIRSLCKNDFNIARLSNSDDTKALLHMLSSEGEMINSGHAGSSYRFMTARACLGDKEVVLDGSAQLRKRPIGSLVKALQTLGADISYLDKEGFPPIRIRPVKTFGTNQNEIHLQAGISSQYITALLLIAPTLKNGIVLHLTDDPVSVPYIKMTLELMRYFGVDHTWENNTITVKPGEYISKDFIVEADWSSASYYYSFAALAKAADLTIEGLTANSLQGDSAVSDLYEKLGVKTSFTEDGIRLEKTKDFSLPKEISIDFSDNPDLAQTMMVTLAGLGIKGKLSGLKTLRIKETDRIVAMQTELKKVKTTLEINEGKNDITCFLAGKAKWKDKAKFDTYEDHRMAMSLSAFSTIHPVIIRDPDVVSKSYPGFWNDVKKIRVNVETRI